MRVLVNALSARRGGILTYTRNLLSGFKDRGIDITIAAPTELGAEFKQDIDVIDITRLSPPLRFLWEQVMWRRIVRRYKPDILFSSANFGLLSCPVKQVLLLREGGLFDPFYIANLTPSQGIENLTNRYFRRVLMLRSASAADHIITPTNTMRDMVSMWHPEIIEKCSVNPYGTINEMFCPYPIKRTWRENEELKLLYVSVYYPHKVPNLICQAVDKLNELGVKTSATITMSPEEFENTKGGHLDKVVVNDAAARQVVSLGNFGYDDLPELYRSHDIFVFPSVSETFGHPMAEAMSSGLPVLASDTPVNREICGDSALYFKPYGCGQLVRQIMLLVDNLGLVQHLRDKGRTRAIDFYSWDKHVERLVKTFQNVLDGKV